MITQSDPGHENYGVTNAQTVIHHHLDPTLAGTMQHQFAQGHNYFIQNKAKTYLKKASRKDGIEWMTFSKSMSQTYLGLNLYHSLVFWWLAIPWLQAEIDEWVHIKNRSAPWADKNKILPHGIPWIIRAKPHKYNALYFKVFYCWSWSW